MAAKKTTKKMPVRKTLEHPAPSESQFTVVLEDIRSQFQVFGESLQGFREEVNARFDRIEGRLDGVEGRLDRVEGRLDGVEGRLDRVEGRLGRVEDAVLTHTKELRQINAKLGDHETRIVKLEGDAAE